MSFGVGCSDILVGIKFAKFIYDSGFVQDNAAAAQYQEFRNDIRDFARLLEDLNDAIGVAALQWKNRSIQARASDTGYNPLSHDFDAERKLIIGDFNATLRDCNSILVENKQFHQNGSNVVQNLVWNGFSGTKGKIAELRSRLRFHHTKILLVIDRLSLGLLTDLDAKVDDLIGLAERHIAISIDTQSLLEKLCNAWSGHVTGDPIPFDFGFEDLHIASAAVAQRFEANDSCAGLFPNISTSLSDAPLADAFDVLLIHFETSIEDNNGGQQYLALLKTRWVLAKLKRTNAYQQARPGFYYKRAIAQIEQAIRERIRSGVVIKVDDETLLTLPEKCFRIWPYLEEEVIPRPDPTVARADEIEVARIPLASLGGHSTDTVAILQRKAHRYRIVPQLAVDDRCNFDAHHDKFIPRYALPSLVTRYHEISIFSRDEEKLYRFQNPDDMYAFQRALLGYEVSYSQRKIKCSFSNKTLKCIGDIQIWQDPIKIDLCLDGGPLSPITSSQTSCSSPGSVSRTNSIASTTATTIARTKDGFQARKIAYPALAIFTTLRNNRDQERLAIIYLKLDQDIRIFTEHCGCGEEATYDECHLLSLERPGRQKFAVKILYSDLDKTGQPDPNSWDLLPFRIPPHPSFAKLETRETTYLFLKFSTPEAKKNFHQELEDRFLLRARQIKEQQTFRNLMIYRQDRPAKDLNCELRKI